MNFFMPMKPPNVTASPLIVKQKLLTALTPYKPKKPMTGPLKLHVTWFFESSNSHAEGEYRSSRPNTDNLQKILKGCMTDKGYWLDDAQVAVEITERKWSRKHPGISVQLASLEAK